MFRKILIANRGEIAIRIARTAADLSIGTVAVFSEDDAHALHIRRCDETAALSGVGASAYLDIDQLTAAARDTGCDAVHPGYGFLSENAEFARRCASTGLVFIGPSPDILDRLGNKTQARRLAESLSVPTLRGTSGPTNLEEARGFFASLGPGAAMMIKAIAGGGGRGIRLVRRDEEIEDSFRRCGSEARAAFGDASLYVEQAIPYARHIEVQIIGDGSGDVIDLGERECSIQRRRQKLIEIAPSPFLSAGLRTRIVEAARQMATAIRYDGIGTFEFLVDERSSASNPEWRPASGRGTIYSYSVARRAAVPYILTYISLEEGPTILSNIVDADFESIRIGQNVRLVFKAAENGQQVPMFAVE